MGPGCLFLTGGVHGFFLSSFHRPLFLHFDSRPWHHELVKDFRENTGILWRGMVGVAYSRQILHNFRFISSPN